MEKKKLVVFTGAGVSADSGIAKLLAMRTVCGLITG